VRRVVNMTALAVAHAGALEREGEAA